MTIEVDDPGDTIPLQLAAVDERQAMRIVELELHVEFPSMPVDQVAILVECLWSHFDGATVRDFVPLLVRKQAQEELRDHLRPRGEGALSTSEATSAPHPWGVVVARPPTAGGAHRMPSATHEPPARLLSTQLSEDPGIEPAAGPA